MAPTWVLVQKTRYVVNEAADADQRSILGFLLEFVPRDDGQGIRGLGPLELLLQLMSVLQLHCQLTFLDFVVGESLKMRGQTNSLHRADEPLGGIILVPLDSVTVVHGELVVEVVVTFTDSDESSDHVVARSVLVIEGSLAEPVSERVDAESRLK